LSAASDLLECPKTEGNFDKKCITIPSQAVTNKSIPRVL